MLRRLPRICRGIVGRPVRRSFVQLWMSAVHVLVINAGSSSIKFQLVDVPARRARIQGMLDRIDTEGNGYAGAVRAVIAKIGDTPLQAVGHRVVHGGDLFSEAVIIDDAVVASIEACNALAPLHNPHNLAGIRAARELLPDLPHVAAFDTAFHSHMPVRARTYAIDPEVAGELHVRRYGFHGNSHAFVAECAAKFVGRPIGKLRLVTCHLGNGASACAVEHGRSVETSMGMTPLEGLVMGTRSGDLDPGAVLHLVRTLGVEQVDSLLNRRSGLAAVSGLGNDLRDIEVKADEGDERAMLALEIFAHRVRKYIGAYAAVMGGMDAVVLTGGIGENSATMRKRILGKFEYLGMTINAAANESAVPCSESPVVDISGAGARVRALVVATNEELMIASETARIVTAHAAAGLREP